MLAAVLFINYVDRGLLPVAAGQVQSDLRLSAMQLGVLLSAFFWTYALIQIPIGWLAERIGAGRVLAAGLVVWAAATVMTGTVSAFSSLLCLRLVLGLGESVGFPCVSKLLAVAVPAEGLGVANGIVGFAYLLGPAFGTYFGALVMARYGWRAAFIGFGTLSLIWLWPWSRIRAPRAPWSRRVDADPTFAMILRERALWGASLGHFSSNYTFYFLLSWLPYYLVRDRGFSTDGMAEVAGGAYLVTAISALVGGWLIDRHVRRGGSRNFAYKSVMAAAHGGAVVCMTVIALGPRPLALFGIFLYQALAGASSPGVYAIGQILAGPRAAGRWVGVQNAMGNLAGIAAPALTGLIIDQTGRFTAAFIVSAGVSLLGLYGWLWMLPPLAQLPWDSPRAREAQPASD